MKKYLVRYTENKGVTYTTVIVSANSFTDAYVKTMELSKDGEITDLFEVMEDLKEEKMQ